MQDPRSKISPWLGAIVLVTTSILVTLLVIEALLYLRPDLIPAVIRTGYFFSDSFQPPRGTVFDKKVGYKFIPNLNGLPASDEISSYTISTVTLGYSDVGFRDEGLDGDVDVVVLGDSVTACVGIEMEACWVEKLENMTGRDFANMGVIGYGQDLQLQLFQEYTLPLRPKEIVWVFFANDLIQGWRYEQFGQGALTEGGVYWTNPVKSWLLRHSSIFLIWTYLWYERHFFRNYYSNDPHLAGNAPLSWWVANTDVTIPEIELGLERTKETILQAYAQTQTELPHSKFVLLILPFREQLEPEYARFHPTFDTAGNDLVRFAQQNGIFVIDITEPLKKRVTEETEPLFFEDSHLTAHGSAVVAEILSPEFTTSKGN